jgi:hypothetical protein
MEARYCCWNTKRSLKGDDDGDDEHLEQEWGI